MKRRLSCVLCLALAAGAATQPDAPTAAPTDAAALREQLRALPASDDARDDLLRQLVDDQPDDPEAPTWLLDRAENALARAARDGASSSLMFGIPAALQPIQVSTNAAAACEHVAQARAAIQAAVARLESRLLAPGLDAQRAREVAAEVEPHLAKLLEVEQAVRLPQIEIVAIALRALSEPAFELRDRLLRELTPRVIAQGPADPSFSPRAAIVIAALLIKSPEPGARDAASRLLDRVLAACSADGGAAPRAIDPADAVRLCMALTLCGRDADAVNVPCPGRGEDWLVDLLLAESRARALSGSADVALQTQAAPQLLAVAKRYDGGASALDTAAGPSAMRQLIYEKVAKLTAPGAAWSTLDPEIALARAWALLSPAGAPPEGERPPSAECLALLESVGARSDAHDALRAQARWLLAIEHIDQPSPDTTAARRTLARIVVETPQARLAHLAAERIVRDHVPGLAELKPAFADDAHRVAVIRALRLIAANPAADDHTLSALVVSITAAEVTGDAWTEAAAACLRINAADLRETTARFLTQQIERSLVTAQSAQERLDLLAAAAQWVEGRGDLPRAQELRLQRAELALIAMPEAEVAAELVPLIGSTLDQSGTPERARLHTALGIAHRRAGDEGRAMTEFRTVAAEYERDARSADAARAPARHAFWSAWAEMLEVAACATDAPDRVEQARRQRQRLELLDPALGGEPWAGRIRAAADSNSK